MIWYNWFRLDNSLFQWSWFFMMTYVEPRKEIRIYKIQTHNLAELSEFIKSKAAKQVWNNNGPHLYLELQSNYHLCQLVWRVLSRWMVRPKKKVVTYIDISDWKIYEERSMLNINARGMLRVTTDKDQENLILIGKVYTKVPLVLCFASCILYNDSILTNILNWYNDQLCSSFYLDLTSLRTILWYAKCLF